MVKRHHDSYSVRGSKQRAVSGKGKEMADID